MYKPIMHYSVSQIVCFVSRREWRNNDVTYSTSWNKRSIKDFVNTRNTWNVIRTALHCLWVMHPLPISIRCLSKPRKYAKLANSHWYLAKAWCYNSKILQRSHLHFNSVKKQTCCLLSTAVAHKRLIQNTLHRQPHKLHRWPIVDSIEFNVSMLLLH